MDDIRSQVGPNCGPDLDFDTPIYRICPQK